MPLSTSNVGDITDQNVGDTTESNGLTRPTMAQTSIRYTRLVNVNWYNFSDIVYTNTGIFSYLTIAG
jgi:uncharacterized membrane protein